MQLLKIEMENGRQPTSITMLVLFPFEAKHFAAKSCCEIR